MRMVRNQSSCWIIWEFAVWLAVIALISNWNGISYAQRGLESAESSPQILNPPKQVGFSDDFLTDSRADYQISGPVEWEKGKLILGDGASIRKGINAGHVAETTVDLDWPALEQGQTWSVEIGFATGAGRRASVILERRRENGGAIYRIRIVRKPDDAPQQPEAKEETPAETVVRSFQGTPNLGPGPVTVAWRHGLVSCKRGNDLIAIALASESGEPLTGMFLACLGGEVTCRTLSLSATTAPPTRTPEEQEALDTAKRLNRQVSRLGRQGKSRQAVPLAHRALEIRKEALGEKHPGYAQSLFKLAGLYYEMVEYARAEPFGSTRGTWRAKSNTSIEVLIFLKRAELTIRC